MMPQPNKNKLPLQVLPITKANSEKIKVWDEACDDIIINHNKTYLLIQDITFFHWHLVWSLGKYPLSHWKIFDKPQNSKGKAWQRCASCTGR